MSHQTDMMPNAARKNSPDHLVLVHRPSDRPATQRHGRQPSHGPMPAGHEPRGSAPTFSARISRLRSRSTSSAAKPHSAQNDTMMSRMPVRDITKCEPSNASRKAATQPSAVDPNIRRATRPTMRIDSVPTSATENRQPQPEPGAEQPLAGRDQPLPGGRVHDHVAVGRREDVLVARHEGVVGLLQRVEHPHLDAEVQQRVGLLDVVGLVEHQGLGAVEVPEPQHPADERDQAGAEPPPQPVGRPGSEQPQAQLVGPGHRHILGRRLVRPVPLPPRARIAP